MPFTPENTLVIRSREFGDGSEYNLSSTSSIIPDHYVKRLWRKPPLMVGAGAAKTVGRLFPMHLFSCSCTTDPIHQQGSEFKQPFGGVLGDGIGRGDENLDGRIWR